MDLDTGKQVSLTIRDVIGESIAVLGIKGSGKTNTAAVLIEEILGASLPLAVVDIEGEYWGLRERFEILVAGRSEHVDVDVLPEQAGQLAEFSLQQGVSVILDLSEFRDEDKATFLLAYFQRLWELNFKLRRPYEIVLEEAHEWIPQGIRTPLKQMLTRIALRGRKRGLGLICVSQRSAKVEKDVLTQAGIVFLHKVMHPTDIKVYQDIIPLPVREVEERIAALQKGQAIVLANNQVTTVQVRLRHTFHAGATPELDQATTPELRKIDGATLEALAALLGQPAVGEDGAPDARAALQRRNAALEQALARKDEEIERLRALLAGKQAARPMRAVSTPHQPSAVIAATSVVEGRDAQRQNVSDNRERARQQKQITRLLHHIQAAPALHRRLISYLVDHEPQEFEAGALDSLLAVSQGSVYKNPPKQFVKLGLVQRRPGIHGFTYGSRIRALLAQDCSLLDEAEIIERIAQAAK